MATFVLMLTTFGAGLFVGLAIEAVRCTTAMGWLDGRNQARIRQLHGKLRVCQTRKEK